MPDEPGRRRRYAIVGTGARAELFARAVALDHAATSTLVALADPNPVRLAAHHAGLARLGVPNVARYPADQFSSMLRRERVDVVIVTTIDRFHDTYLVAALEAGCDAITEKPMAIDAPGCQRILDAVDRTGRTVTVAFNYRYSPVHETVKRVLAGGEIGEIGSVHFEWLLDVRHGADYFRRWHRRRANSGGLLVHKASHHFDLVNWWLAADPVEVYALGRLFFYGGEAGRRHGYHRDYDRAHGAPAALGDPFALRLADHPRLTELYLDAEHLDGYRRDENVFGPGIDIEDDMAVLVRYTTGASMSYHLTAYAPWEGYRVMVNGSRGRLELEVVENDHVSPATADGVKGEARHADQASAALHGVEAAGEDGHARLMIHPFWRKPYELTIDGYAREGHGGADRRMLTTLLSPVPGAPVDELGRGATDRDGARALLVGLAANASFTTGRAVRVADLLHVPTTGRDATAPDAAATDSDRKEPTA
ncbi:MAG: Gfo/Idh/MocA family oxidoreductase [Dactylosporangium sp.]|nr:Gfo/Idh/MocA family oxidoreductase [Dactylosporangium sp.]NNJ61638.1 Gfo/Idh/MocA family oxidoreductase [Dactylosporangium sp.]